MPPEWSDREAQAARILATLALAEDLGDRGDATSAAFIPAATQGRAAFVARSEGVVAGLPVLAVVAALVSRDLAVTPLVEDGTPTTPGLELARLDGPMCDLLTAERTCLNFLQRLSGVATLTSRYRTAMGTSRAALLDTRKTTPGWRRLEKYAVRAGGGTNHRMGLFDGILVKDNHLAALGTGDEVWSALERRIRDSREREPQLPIEIEVDTLEQLERVLPLRPDIVLLDNMPPDVLRQAIARRDAVAAGVKLEASGGINLETIGAVAATGIDRISVGALTHSAVALDIGLDYRG